MDIEALLADSDSDGDVNLDDINLEDLLAGDSSDGSDDDGTGRQSVTMSLPPASEFAAFLDFPAFGGEVNEDLEALLRDAVYDDDDDDGGGGVGGGGGGGDEDDGNLDKTGGADHIRRDASVKDIIAEAGQYAAKRSLTQASAQAPAATPAPLPPAVHSAAGPVLPWANSLAMSPPRRTSTKSRLELAESREQRLLKSGVSETLSPLQGKRRVSGFRPPDGDQGPGSGGGVVLSNLDAISRQLQKNAAVQFQHSPGLPTAVSVHGKFIAVGTDRSLVLLFDHFQEVRQILGSTGDAERDGPVTSIDVSPGGDLLCSGFVSGKVVLWDIVKGTVLKAVPEAHASPLTVVRFYNEGAASVVSVDTRGCVNKLSFVKTMWRSYDAATECLLDGAAGQVPALAVLPPWSFTEAARAPTPPKLSADTLATSGAEATLPSPLQGLSLIAISSEKSSFVVTVEPAVKVIHKWARPPEVRPDGSEPFLPCLSWGWSLVRGGGAKVMPVLARGWGLSIQLLRVAVEAGAAPGAAPVPSFVPCESFGTAAPVLAVEWIGQQVVAFLDARFDLHIMDSLSMSRQVTDVSGVKLVHATYIRSSGQPPRPRTPPPASLEEGAVAPSSTDVQSFQNSFRASDGKLYLLGGSSLQTARVQSWQQRVEALVEDGEWLEALAHSLDHYETAIKPFNAPRLGEASPLGGVEVVSPAAGLVADLLLRYLNLAIENAPVHKSAPVSRSAAAAKGAGRAGGSRSARIDLVQSHFQMIAGVCIEFLVVVDRLDLLFGQVFNRFVAANQARVFLDLLEPYVLQEKVTYLGPEVMQSFVDHFQHKGDLSAVERCLLHMDVKMLDFNNIVTILRKHKLYSALIHVYTSGLDEYIPPLELMLEGAMEAWDRTGQAAEGVPGFETVGYKALLYVHYCLKGMGFPSGTLAPERIGPLQREIMEFVLMPTLSPSTRRRLRIPADAEPLGDDASTAARLAVSSFPYLRLLLRVDAQCALQAFSLVLDQPRTPVADAPEALNAPSLVKILAAVVAPALDAGGDPASAHPSWASFPDATACELMEFVARHMAACRPSQPLTDAVLQHLASGRAGIDPSQAHAVLAATLASLSPAGYDRAALLPLLEAQAFTRAALVLHKTATAGTQRGKTHFPAAIQCFLVDPEADFRKQVFSYMAKELEQQRLRAKADPSAEDTLRAMKTTVMVQLAVLVELDREATVRMVASLFADDHKRVLKALASTPRQQYGLLAAMVSGLPGESDEGGAAGASHFVLDGADLSMFVGLMAQFDPSSVYKYLSTHTDYPLDECARICRDHNITEAEAYLLERLGDISGALDLILRTIEQGLEALKLRLRGTPKADLVALGVLPAGQTLDAGAVSSTGRTALTKIAEGQVVKRNIGVAIEVCERSTAEGATTEAQAGTQLWNYMLDRLLMSKSLLKLKDETPHVRLVLEAVITEVLQRAWNKMSAHVPLARIVRKITDDHSESQLGELRDIILSVLDTSSYESSIYNTSVSLVATDLRKLNDKRRCIKGAGIGVHGLRVAATSDFVQFGDEAMAFPTDSKITGARGGFGEVSTMAALAAKVAFEGDAASLEATVRRSRLDRTARRLRPKITLSDHMARAGQPALLSTAPRGIKHSNVPTARRVPGTLPREAKHVSQF